MNDNKLYGAVLIKAASILDVLSQSSEAMTMKEIADACQYTQSTTSKILNTLQAIDYIKRDSHSKRYTLGSRLIYLANSAFLQFDIVRETYPALKFLHDQFQETVHLGTLQDNQILYLNKLSTYKNNQEMLSRIGYTQKLYCSAMGKAILSTFSPEEQKQYITHEPLIARTPYTITTPEALLTQLQEINELGYALDEREAESHVFCVGACLQLNAQSSQYAFSISVPYSRITPELKKEMIAAVIKTKNILEFQLHSQIK